MRSAVEQLATRIRIAQYARPEIGCVKADRLQRVAHDHQQEHVVHRSAASRSRKEQRGGRRIDGHRAPRAERRNRKRRDRDRTRGPRMRARYADRRRPCAEIERTARRRTNLGRRDTGPEQHCNDRAVSARGGRISRTRLHVALQRRVGFGRQIARFGLAVRPSCVVRRPAGRMDRAYTGFDEMSAQSVDQLRVAHARRRAGRAAALQFAKKTPPRDRRRTWRATRDARRDGARTARTSLRAARSIAAQTDDGRLPWQPFAATRETHRRGRESSDSCPCLIYSRNAVPPAMLPSARAMRSRVSIDVERIHGSCLPRHFIPVALHICFGSLRERRGSLSANGITS